MVNMSDFCSFTGFGIPYRSIKNVWQKNSFNRLKISSVNKSNQRTKEHPL